MEYGSEIDWQESPTRKVTDHCDVAKRKLAEAQAKFDAADRAYVKAVESRGLDKAHAASQVRALAGDRLHQAKVDCAVILKMNGGGVTGRRDPVSGPSERGHLYEPR